MHTESALVMHIGTTVLSFASVSGIHDAALNDSTATHTSHYSFSSALALTVSVSHVSLHSHRIAYGAMHAAARTVSDFSILRVVSDLSLHCMQPELS